MQNRDRHDPREPEGNPRVAPHAALEEVGEKPIDWQIPDREG